MGMNWQKISGPVIHRLALVLSRFGVDARQYEALLSTSLTLDFRSTSLLSHRGVGSGSRSALLLTNFIYFLFSSVLGIFLLGEGNLRLYIWMLLSYSMVMLAMAILIEFGSTVINPDDFQILGARPVSSRTYFAVKFSNLAFYILIFGTSLNLVPSVLGTFLPGSRFYFPFVYFPIAILSALFTAGLITALYGILLRYFNYERFKDIIAYFQIAFSFLAFFGYQLIPRYLQRQRTQGEFAPQGWIRATPSLWFANMIQLGLGTINRQTVLLSCCGVIAIVLFAAILVRSVSIHYSEHISNMLSQSSKRRSTRYSRTASRSWSRRLQLLLRSSEERAIFHFIVTMIRRNRQLKIQFYPNLGIIFVFLAMALLDHRKMVDPFIENRLEISTAAPVLAFLFAALGITSLLPYSDEYVGSWIFSAAPTMRRDRLLSGVKKAIAAVVFLPLFVICVAVFSFFWPLHHAVLYNIYAMLGGYLFFEILLFRLRGLPFTRKIEKGTQNQRLLLVLFFLPVAGLMILLQRKALASPTHFLSALVIMLLIGFLLSRLNAARYGNVPEAPTAH